MCIYVYIHVQRFICIFKIPSSIDFETSRLQLVIRKKVGMNTFFDVCVHSPLFISANRDQRHNHMTC